MMHFSFRENKSVHISIIIFAINLDNIHIEYIHVYSYILYSNINILKIGENLFSAINSFE